MRSGQMVHLRMCDSAKKDATKQLDGGSPPAERSVGRDE